MISRNTPPEKAPLYTSEQFTLYHNQVVQGDNTADILSATKIKSNYQSKESEAYSRRIQFRFSINKKDNELPFGKDHWLVINDEHESPVVVFGAETGEAPEDPPERLPVNYEYTFRLNMRPVLKQFEEKGYYETVDGDRIAQADFKNVYIAGPSEPLTLDFSTLEAHGLVLKDFNGDGIFEITLLLNPYDPEDYAEKTWELTEDLSAQPTYTSDQLIVDALFNMSLEEAIQNIEPDHTLRTGARWGGVWTRDVSYSILLAFAYHEPEVAKISLMHKVNADRRIIQDTGSGGAYPVSSDRTTWALAAWEIYKTTGDQEWLASSYQIIKNTLDDDDHNLPSPTGLYRGESSFLDWREQTYPKWMDNRDIYVSENLGTNVVHYQAHIIVANMARILGKPDQEYQSRAEGLKAAINEQLWQDDPGYYAQFLYGRINLSVSPRFEALGEALAVLFGVADQEQAQSIVQHSPLTPFGTTCIYPQIPDIPPYHNNGIWPFVQAYWNWAAARAGNETVLEHGLASLYRAGALFLTNYENFVADSGDFMGTEINSHRMLWSIAGNLSMVHRVFMGMHFEEDAIRFSPVIPRAYGGTKQLSNFTYRAATLDITVEGYGNQIAAFQVDGKEKTEPIFPANLSGRHRINIRLADNDFSGRANRVKNKFTPATPAATLKGNVITWDAIKEAVAYTIFKDGQEIATQPENRYSVAVSEHPAEYQVQATDAAGLASFRSEPLRVFREDAIRFVGFEHFNPQSLLPYTNFQGDGFVETSLENNPDVRLTIDAQAAGKCIVDVRYSNGTGPWNTDNNCALRTLYVNGEQIGTIVMPQRGTDEWSDWGYTNSYFVELREGANEVELRYEAWNANMDSQINKAMLDGVRVLRCKICRKCVS